MELTATCKAAILLGIGSEESRLTAQHSDAASGTVTRQPGYHPDQKRHHGAGPTAS
ncbi:hypothetical protein B597_003300 [Stutzerimonas stutzeri KOS6]|uniref:Uncharacterized protein n=1 Tax=Stutzerimonas stutzeri KOS6 TaxID=1218352 RepID=A0A061JWG9_STUST|nr:hypothetical protein B597_003300 [Stutzerimonas stutzeri KOS6]